MGSRSATPAACRACWATEHVPRTLTHTDDTLAAPSSQNSGSDRLCTAPRQFPQLHLPALSVLVSQCIQLAPCLDIGQLDGSRVGQAEKGEACRGVERRRKERMKMHGDVIDKAQILNARIS